MGDVEGAVACGVSGVVCFSKLGVDADLVSPCAVSPVMLATATATSSSLLPSSSCGVESSVAGVGVGDVLPAAAAAIASGLVAVEELESAMIYAPEVLGVRLIAMES